MVATDTQNVGTRDRLSLGNRVRCKTSVCVNHSRPCEAMVLTLPVILPTALPAGVQWAHGGGLPPPGPWPREEEGHAVQNVGIVDGQAALDLDLDQTGPPASAPSAGEVQLHSVALHGSVTVGRRNSE